jgi:hypothetical protein
MLCVVAVGYCLGWSQGVGRIEFRVLGLRARLPSPRAEDCREMAVSAAGAAVLAVRLSAFAKHCFRF